MSLRVHALVLALNEEVFITNLLNTLYPFCCGISVMTQYDRDWFGKRVPPDSTLDRVANHPDPEGKIHMVLRRWRSQPAALNCEIGALSSRAAKGVLSPWNTIARSSLLSSNARLFLDRGRRRIYDPETVPAMLEYLERRRPQAGCGCTPIIMWGRRYHRVPMDVVRFCQFGFVRAGQPFASRVRGVTWRETAASRLLNMARLPDFSARLFGFLECPKEIAVFHHGCWVGDRERLAAKAAKSAHLHMKKRETTLKR